MERRAIKCGLSVGAMGKPGCGSSAQRLALFLTATAIVLLIAVYPVIAAETGGYSRASYVFPPGVAESGLFFAGVRIPLDRQEVSSRVFEQINYLLMDRRAGMMEWFDRMAICGPTIR
ncbi:MAG: hypothetical protein HY912_06900, partial [Desulfomonile tiedjei]|nr:hypothetical protein [Desulfomonile tiedjei]